MSRPHDPHDPGADPEDEGIPDPRDGPPERQWSSDPKQLPVSGDEPTSPIASRACEVPLSEERDAAVDEVLERELLDARLADEEPEGDADMVPGPQDEPGGLLYDEPDPGLAWEQDVYSQEDSADGLSAEEAAARTKLDEDFEDDTSR